MKKQIAIRVDSGNIIGFGHAMRCLTIANQMKKHNYNVSIISSKEKNNLDQLFIKNGYKIYHVNNKKIDLRKIHEKYDLEQTKKILKNINKKIDLLLVDHYSLGFNWEKSLRRLVEKIVVIDDLNNRKHDCDLIVDQGLHHNMKKAYRHLVTNNCKILLGPKYAILRPEFHQIREKLPNQNKKIERIIISFGGSDPNGDTIKALDGIMKIKNREFRIDVIVGKSNLKYKKIMRMCEKMIKTRCFYNVKKIASVMSKCDLAIGSGGSTTWERCCLGIPSIVCIASQDQNEATNILYSKKCIINLGQSKKIMPSDFANAIENMTYEKRRKMRGECLKLVDGNGTKRIIQKILST